MQLDQLTPRVVQPRVIFAVYGALNTANEWFNKSTNIEQRDVFAYRATEESQAAAAFAELRRQVLDALNDQPAWVVFTYAHLKFRENLAIPLFHCDTNTVYGFAGVHPANPGVVFCNITGENGDLIGATASQMPVITVSDDCIIIHTDLLKDLEFDTALVNHFVFADIALECKKRNLPVKLLEAKVAGPGIIAHDSGNEQFTTDRNTLFTKWHKLFPIVHTFYGWFSVDSNAAYILETDITGRVF